MRSLAAVFVPGASREKMSQDEWGHHPSVQKTRKMFSEMEYAQTAFLKRMKISPFDARLRQLRETARGIFEKAYPLANEKTGGFDANSSALLYTSCLAQAFNLAGLNIPEEILPEDNAFALLVKEVSQ